MAFLPYEKFGIDSPMRPKEVVEALQASVDERMRPRLFKDNTKTYWGNIWGTTFRLRPSFSNSLMPTIEGTIKAASGGGSRIQITFLGEPHILISLPLLILDLIALIYLGNVLVRYLYGDPIVSEVAGLTLIPILLSAVGYPLMMGSYNFEAEKSRWFLYTLLDASSDSSNPNSRLPAS
jgi:hypothetical protein